MVVSALSIVIFLPPDIDSEVIQHVVTSGRMVATITNVSAFKILRCKFGEQDNDIFFHFYGTPGL